MLRARDVWDEQDQRRQNRMAAMIPVIAQIQAKIKQQAIHSPNAPYIMYEVPNFVFGYPLYSISEAIEYLNTEFIKAGYMVWIVENKYLFICWIKTGTKKETKPTLTTNYRPQAYNPDMLAFMSRNTDS